MIAEPRLATVARRGATVAMGHVGAAGVAPLGERWPHRLVPGRRGESIGSFMGDILHSGAMVCRLFWDCCVKRAIPQLQFDFLARHCPFDDSDHGRSGV
jgi:hypothetical protein